MNLRPLRDRVVIRRVEADKKIGNIFIPETAKDKPCEGHVVAIGNGKTLEDGTTLPPSVKEGERVLFPKYGGNEIQLDGEELIVVRDEDIFGVVEQ